MLLILLLCFTIVTANDQGDEVPQEENLQDILSRGGMFIGRGRTKRYVQLDGKEANVQYESCELPNGKPGLCKPINLCKKEEYQDNFIMFSDSLCLMNKKVGICCEDKTNDLASERLAGDLPAIAAKDEDITSRVGTQMGTRNRGCGLSTRSQEGRVSGARPADIREWPWMVSVTTPYYEPYCGGVLITDRHVITAAHCLQDIELSELQVRLGEYDFQRQNDTRSYNFKVTEMLQHEEYDRNTFMNDIAILKLDRPAVFNTYVWPVCLPPMGMDLVNQTAYVIGWGTQSLGGPQSEVLMEASLPIWDLEQCMDALTDTVFESNICAGAYEGGKDACQHDSGGPLMYQMQSGRWVVVGIVSWGVRCGEAEHPGLYTRVDNFLEWIVANAQF